MEVHQETVPEASPTIPANASTPPSNSREMPSPPLPTASIQEVERFFRDYFLASDRMMSLDQAVAKAKQFRTNGKTLYTLEADDLKDAFGPDGKGIFDLVAQGEHSYAESYWPLIKLITKLLVLLAAGTGIFQFHKDSKDRNFTLQYFIIAIVLPIILLHQFSSPKYLVNSKYYPHRLKIRNPTAAAVSTASWIPFGS